MKRIFALFTLLILQVAFVPAHAAECRKISDVCVDGPSTKIINGEPITRPCWKYDAAYECVEGNAVNTCAPLQADGCWQSAVPVCTNYAFNGTCLDYENTYRCSNEQTPIPVGVIFLSYAYTITNDTINNQCATNESNNLCTLGSETCVEGAETRNINGLDVYKACWKWERNYTCGTFSNAECADLVSNPYCSLTSTTCVETLGNTSTCIVWDKTFTCSDPSTAVTQTKTTCENKVTCINGFCFESGSAPDPDFLNATSWMEIARQAGAYQDPDTLELFKGTSSQCRVRTWGTCCKIKGAGDSANSFQYGQSGGEFSVTGTVARNAVNFAGSSYVHDALFMSDLVSDGAMNFMYGGAMGGSSFAPSLSYMGLTVSYSSAGGLVFGFCVPCLAFQLVLMFVQEVLTCSMDQPEQMLALRRGANLCNYVGSYCSKKILGWCYERKQGYCCYNSKLAKIINTQGRAQLGKSYGSPQSPDCSGFSPTELASLDFSLMDMSEFYAEIIPKNLDIVGTQAVISDNLNCKTESGSYFGGTNPLCNKNSTPGVIIDQPVVTF